MAASDKRSPGQAFRPPPAPLWNGMVAAGEQYLSSQLDQRQGAPHRPRETDKIRCKNASGSARRRGEILGDFTNPLTNLEPDRLRLAGSLPTEGGHFGILLKATPDGEYEDLQVSGACIALVNIDDESHTRAKCDGSTHVLESSDEGPIEILYAPSGTGEQECFVRFGGSGGGDADLAIFQLGEAYGGTVTGATFYDVTDPTLTTPIDSGFVHDPLEIFAGLGSGDVGLAIKKSGLWYMIQAKCPETEEEV